MCRIKKENNYILNNPTNMYIQEEQKLDNLIEKLNRNITYDLEKKQTKLDNIKTKLELLNPLNILDKGYSVTMCNGKIIKNIDDIKSGDLITTKISNGNFESIVK